MLPLQNGKTPLDVAIENESDESARVLTDFIRTKKLKPPHDDTLLCNLQEQPCTSRVAESTLSVGDDLDEAKKSPYSFYKTSTFNEVLDDATVTVVSKLRPTAPSRNELESLISDLIDAKLKEKARPRTAKSSSHTNVGGGRSRVPNRAAPVGRSSSHTAAAPPAPTKTVAATQTRITGKRFYSPEKLPAFHAATRVDVKPPPLPPSSKLGYCLTLP